MILGLRNRERSENETPLAVGLEPQSSGTGSLGRWRGDAAGGRIDDHQVERCRRQIGHVRRRGPIRPRGYARQCLMARRGNCRVFRWIDARVEQKSATDCRHENSGQSEQSARENRRSPTNGRRWQLRQGKGGRRQRTQSCEMGFEARPRRRHTSINAWGRVKQTLCHHAKTTKRALSFRNTRGFPLGKVSGWRWACLSSGERPRAACLRRTARGTRNSMHRYWVHRHL